MIKYLTILLCTLLIGCGSSNDNIKESAIPVIDAKEQDTLFQLIMQVTNNHLPERVQTDSVAFLILPLQQSCPSCRDKTIDSIVFYNRHIASNRFIILSAHAGVKNAGVFFKERGHRMPPLSDQFYMDSTNKASSFHLFESNPAFYYAANGKVYKKSLALPATIKQDLQNFFRKHTLTQAHVKSHQNSDH